MSDAAKEVGEIVSNSAQVRAERRAKLDAEHWKAQVKELERELEVAEKRLDFVDSVKGQQRDRVIDKAKSGGNATALLVLSDWHCGERVDPAQVDHRNEYSPEVFQQRVRGMFQHVGLMLDFARTFATIRTMEVFAIGDFITGYIHEELKKSNYIAPTEETLLFQDEMNAGLKFLKKEAGLKSITVRTKPGNHGRTTEKPQIKDEHLNSYEWLAYKTMERWFQIPGVSWVVEPGYLSYATINGRDYRYHHGHAIRSKGGVGGPYVTIAQRLHHWNKTRQSYRDLMGHLHQYMPMAGCSVNSSLIGYSEFSTFHGFGWEPPSQTFIVDSEKRGGILTERVFCE